MDLVIGGRAQGKKEWVKNQYPNCTIWDSFHLFVKEELQKGYSKEEIQCIVEERLMGTKDLVIISDEIGNGIVPLQKEERVYRDITGELLQELAKRAEKVVRITCGIAQQIK
ncbi:MAG: bifunctional adenosylcobinamide kinase/adenosylcobinamide-phosphate guanylyltransferase [Firmicutes bacterium]|nr:bifunctional adenosylcobinamide kinase/adenosylcobinamide-phosphate guanylyltransferase [Bacillota bacterium]